MVARVERSHKIAPNIAHKAARKSARKIVEGTVAHGNILDAADELFYREGARNVGIDAIVKHAGVNKMSLYRQFESKEDLLNQYLLRKDEMFWGYFNASLAKHPDDPRRQLQQIFIDYGKRAVAVTYRGCPFVNIAVEFPDPDHAARRMVADNKRRLLQQLTKLSKAAGAHDAAALAKGLALLLEGAYTASQTYGRGNPLMAALPQVADVLISAALKSD